MKLMKMILMGLMLAIGFCRQDGSVVKVYDEDGHHIWTQDGTLVSYTSKTVTIKRWDATYIYDAEGHHINTIYR